MVIKEHFDTSVPSVKHYFWQPQLTRTLTTLLFEVSATDATVFASAPLLLATVAMVGCYIPARRATRVDSLVALRHQ